MINSPNQSNLQLTWQALLWRVLLTLFLLMALAGRGLNLFSAIATPTDSPPRPVFSQGLERGR
ncbi:MAG: hypothetical protein AB1801_12350 [Chloroflexota bacterium]